MDEVDSFCNKMKIDEQQNECTTFNGANETSYNNNMPKIKDDENYCETNLFKSNNLMESGETSTTTTTTTTTSPSLTNGKTILKSSSSTSLVDRITLNHMNHTTKSIDNSENNNIDNNTNNSDAVNGDNKANCDDQDSNIVQDNKNDSICDIDKFYKQQFIDEVKNNGNAKSCNGHVDNLQGNVPIVVSTINNGYISMTKTNNTSSSKKKDDNSAEATPFPMLAGEKLRYKKEKLINGYLYLTNYRIYMKPLENNDRNIYRNYPHLKNEEVINIPIGVIDSIENRDISLLIVFTKFVHSFTLKFESNEAAVLWCKRLNDIRDDEIFCFKYCESISKKSIGDLGNYEQLNRLMKKNKEEISFQKNDRHLIQQEFQRMGFNSNAWKICDLNKDFKFCNSYPRYFIVPKEINDKELELVGTFRYSRRIPVVVWRSQRNGCVIARSSQPMVGWLGWLGWRNSQDEKLLQNILRLCNQDTYDSYQQRKKIATDDIMADDKRSQDGNAFKENGFTFQSNGDAISKDCSSNENDEDVNGVDGVEGVDSVDNDDDRIKNENESINITRKLLILDARSYAAAIANRAIGGGCECVEYYANCDVQFMCLNNIHSIRKSFYALRFICEPSQIDHHSWLTMLDGTKWFHYLSSLLKAAGVVADAISIQERPVLVHCSDGWDRTPQVIALAQILLDPYYRTFKGFRILIEREYLQFGHKFADRCRSSTLNIDLNERCPVFLQFLDCVHQLVLQFPAEFEFNDLYLIKLAHHTYSCLFGTFQCNTLQERLSEHVYERTFSIWAYFEVEKAKFENPTYNRELEVLNPSNRVKDMVLWDDVYVPCVNSAIPSDWFEIFFTDTNNDSTMSDDANNDLCDESNEELTCKVGYKSLSRGELNRSLSYKNLPSPQKKDDTCENTNIANITRHLSHSCLFDNDTMDNYLLDIDSTMEAKKLNEDTMMDDVTSIHSNDVIESSAYETPLEVTDCKRIQILEEQLDFYKKQCKILMEQMEELRREKISSPNRLEEVVEESNDIKDLINSQHSNAITTATSGAITTKHLLKQIEKLDPNIENKKYSNENIAAIDEIRPDNNIDF